jgi:hypothetical protein
MLIYMDMESGTRSYAEPAAEAAWTSTAPTERSDELALRLEPVTAEPRHGLSSATQAWLDAGAHCA